MIGVDCFYIAKKLYIKLDLLVFNKILENDLFFYTVKCCSKLVYMCEPTSYLN